MNLSEICEKNSRLLKTIFGSLDEEKIKEYFNLEESYTNYLQNHIKSISDNGKSTDFTNAAIWMDSVVKRCGLTNKKILDLGCGFGEQSFMLSNYDNTVVGLTIMDFEMEIFNKLRTHPAYHPKENNVLATGVIGDAVKLPFQKNSFDVVYCNQFISHVSDLTKSLIEAKRVLRDGGEIIIIDNYKYNLIHLIQYAPFRSIMKAQDTYFRNLRVGIIKEHLTKSDLQLNNKDIDDLVKKTGGYSKEEIIEILLRYEKGKTSMSKLLKKYPKKFRYRNPLTGYYVERYFTIPEVTERLVNAGFSTTTPIQPYSDVYISRISLLKNIFRDVNLARIPLIKDILSTTRYGLYMVRARK